MDVSVIMMPVTLMTAGGARIINFWLACASPRSPVGKGQHRRWRQRAADLRMRAQANFVEYAPFILILDRADRAHHRHLDLALDRRALPSCSPVSRTRWG